MKVGTANNQAYRCKQTRYTTLDLMQVLLKIMHPLLPQQWWPPASWAWPSKPGQSTSKVSASFPDQTELQWWGIETRIYSGNLKIWTSSWYLSVVCPGSATIWLCWEEGVQAHVWKELTSNWTPVYRVTLSNIALRDLYLIVRERMELDIKSASLLGCTIMFDGWTDRHNAFIVISYAGA